MKTDVTKTAVKENKKNKMTVFCRKVKENINKIALSLVIGGSIGNLIDRIVRGAVVDFLDFKIFGYNYPIFNLADTFIVLGVFLLLISMFRKDKNNDRRHK